MLATFPFREEIKIIKTLKGLITIPYRRIKQFKRRLFIYLDTFHKLQYYICGFISYMGTGSMLTLKLITLA